MTKRSGTAEAPAAPLTPRGAKAAAVVRVLARRRAPRWAEYPDGNGGVIRFQRDAGGEFEDPRNLGEWVDDRVCRCPVGTPVADTLAGIFELCRGGAAAARDAVAFAERQLRDPAGQFAVWTVISAMPGGIADVEALKAALAREWKARGLAQLPTAPVMREPADWNQPSRRASEVKYRSPWGQPAGFPA